MASIRGFKGSPLPNRDMRLRNISGVGPTDAKHLLYWPQPTMRQLPQFSSEYASMDKFFFMHQQKVKTNEELAARIGHNARDVQPKNADKKRKNLNFDLLGEGIGLGMPTGQEVVTRIEKLVKERGNPKPLKSRKEFVEPTLAELKALKTKKARKRRENPNGNDGVVAVEFVATGSHEYLNAMSRAEIERYFGVCKDFFDSKMGPSNCVQAAVHLDERTPNAHFTYLPMICEIDKRSNLGKQGIGTWRYSALSLVGGESERMREWQDELHAILNKNGFAVDRGEIGSGRQQESIHEHHTAAKRKVKQAEGRELAANDNWQDAEKAKTAAIAAEKAAKEREAAAGDVIAKAQAERSALAADRLTFEKERTTFRTWAKTQEAKLKESMAVLDAARKEITEWRTKVREVVMAYMRLESGSKGALKQHAASKLAEIAKIKSPAPMSYNEMAARQVASGRHPH